MTPYLYITDGELYLSNGTQTFPLASAFAEKYIDKLRKNVQQKEWKTKGEGAIFTRGSMEDPEEKLAQASCRVLCARRYGKEVMYTMSIDGVCGIYRRSGLKNPCEGIVLGDNAYRYGDFDLLGQDLVVAAASGRESHIARLDVRKSGYTLLTDGQAYDTQPVFSRFEKDVIYYTSFGLPVGAPPPPAWSGLSMQQRLWEMQQELEDAALRGPGELFRLDMQTGALDLLFSHPDFDFCHPATDGNGALYYIKRPHKAHRKGEKRGCLWDLLLFPVRLVKGIVGFFNYFTILYSGQPITGGDSKRKDEGQLFLDDNLIQAEKELKANRAKKEAYPGIIPASWELHRKCGDRDEVLAHSVLAYALCGEDILYSNGSAILRRKPDGSVVKERDAARVTLIVPAGEEDTLPDQEQSK